MAEDVLNPSLYRRLAARFGTVRVANRGEAMVFHAVPRPPGGGRPGVRVTHAGEYYRVCCPYCGDTRHRLYVNHCFGRADPFGRPMLFLAICYNENCLSRRENFLDFLEELDAASLAEARLRPGRAVTPDGRPPEVAPPGPLTPLDRLEADHPACVYLRSRGFDPAELARRYGVAYCAESRYGYARGRLIIPVRHGGRLVGWQARYVGELDWKGPDRRRLPPKYFSAPGSHFKSRVIFNWDRMKRYRTGVLVEGPTDVFRFGPMAGCVFGNTVSAAQRRLFATVFARPGRSGILLFDPEEYDSPAVRDALAFFRARMPGRFCAVRLPDGTDPGGLDRRFLRDYVRAQAAEQGVLVVYRRRKPRRRPREGGRAS